MAKIYQMDDNIIAEMESRVIDEAKGLLISMIRNGCTNDGEFCNEEKNIIVLEDFFKSKHIRTQRYEMEPGGGRPNLLASFGSGKSPKIMLGPCHVDVVPASSDQGWRHDPFSGKEIKNEETGISEIWGRGAIDMLQTVAIQAAVFATLYANEEFKAKLEAGKGTLMFGAVADEEAGGKYGAGFVVKNCWEEWKADYTISEIGGAVLPGTTKYLMGVGEKGILGVNIVCEGQQGHGSVPLNADNALVRASEIIGKLHRHKPRVQITEAWRRFVQALGKGWFVSWLLTNSMILPRLIKHLNSSSNPETRKIAPLANALTSMTISPNHLTGTDKVNVVPGKVKLQVDIRGLPGQSYQTAWNELERALGRMHIITDEEISEQYTGELPDFLSEDNRKKVRVLNSDPKVKLYTEYDEEDPYSAGNDSSFDTPLWRAMESAASELVEGAELVPLVIPGTTDSRFYRLHPLSSAVSYGASLFHPSEPFGVVMERFHGVDERISVDSIILTTKFYQRTLQCFFEV